MASNAYKNYQKNLVDVKRLIESHSVESGSKKGKKGLGHLTRSGIVMLCASFEVFIEEIVEETISIYIDRIPSIKDFPKQVKKRLVYKAKENNNELEILNLTGDGWKQSLVNYSKHDLGSLHTPKCHVIDTVTNRYIGIKDFSSTWDFNKKELNDFVSIRGEIAHNGAKARYIKIKYLKESVEKITKLVQEIDCKICDHINEKTCCGQPWRKRYN